MCTKDVHNVSESLPNEIKKDEDNLLFLELFDARRLPVKEQGYLKTVECNCVACWTHQLENSPRNKYLFFEFIKSSSV